MLDHTQPVAERSDEIDDRDPYPVTDASKLAVPLTVQQAVRTLIEWTGDDPDRGGLVDTPKRFARAWKEYCAGYAEDPAVHLKRIFEEVGGYDEVVLLRDIPFESHCEHHMAPIKGKAHIAYLPKNRVVGISKLARVVQGFARRLQVQERLTPKWPTASGRICSPPASRSLLKRPTPAWPAVAFTRQVSPWQRAG